jgi:hypothetical protein
MPLIHFQKRFAEDVRLGRKLQTIRLERKRPIKLGDNLILVTWIGTAYRSKTERLRITTCIKVEKITIEAGQLFQHTYVNDHEIHGEQKERLARADGFNSFREMLDWFRETHGLPFHGVIIHWPLATDH